MPLAPGTRLGHFSIVGSIGAGGMGEVYRATDTKLGRAVAIKVLPADVATDPNRLERFRREATALAALDHPNIVTVFSVEDAGGVPFLTMQLVDGESLDRTIPPGGLSLEQLLDVGGAIADALAAAHDKGIVHRDLKPGNVMVTADGRVKVLDFGLAKIGMVSPDQVPEDPTILQTREGVVMGTVPYMSPEQVAGRAIDHRTDLFSLGVMLYEMASGQRPFVGASSVELASAILRDTPALVSDRRTDIPAGLARLIHRCLEKDKGQRIQSAREAADECRTLKRHASQPSGVHTDGARLSSAVGVRTTADEGFWILVRPFKYTGPNVDLTELAEGVTDGIVAGLSRFSYLRVIARADAGSDRHEGMDGRASGAHAGARYVMEGTLRQAGTKLRLAAQLVDRVTGAHLWAENYERTFTADALFDLQDDLVPRIVSTVADLHGVLPRSMSAAVRSRPPDQLSPYEAVLRSFAYFERVTAEELAAARAGLEAAVRNAPDYADAWATLALLCVQDYGQGFNVGADSLARGSVAARRAVEAGPANHLAFFSLAQALFFERDLDAFRHAAERATALNPMDGNSTALLGELLVYAGDTERGLALADYAKQLNPHHPWWYGYANYFAAYNRGDYRGALGHVLKFNTANHWGAQSATLAVCGQLGEQTTGARALKTLLNLRPDFASRVRADMEKWWDAAAVELFIEGLRKGGLDVPARSPAPSAASTSRAASAPDSGAHADEGLWVAVLPFKYTGADADVAALADGLSEAIVSGLSLFSYLRVVARSSTVRYAHESADVRIVGRQMGARYVMEGTLRQAGTQLRVAVQLIDATTGAQLWGETYDRPFKRDAIFALQDELAPRIVSTIADGNGALPRSMGDALRGRDARDLTPHEAVLKTRAGDAAVAIAVLPFADMSAAQDQHYLCEGMAEEIMHALVPIRGIRVASRTSAFRARRDGGDLPAIARALSVNHVLEGSVRTSGSRLRVTAQLTDVASGYQLWSDRFDRDAADVFAIQDDIAAGVVAAVKTRLAPGEQTVRPRPQGPNLEAYRAYLRGRHLRGIEDHAGALQAFEEALRLDPSHAPSWTGLAEITVLSSVFSLIPVREACRTARSALETAASLQGESSDGWHVEAFACWIERRWEAMEIAWRRALEIEPRHVLALGSFGAVLCTRQRFEEAAPILERARQADPLASFPYALSGFGYLTCGKVHEAERHLEDALSFEKDDVTALYCMAVAKVALGRVTEGVALAERAVTLSHRGGLLVGILGWALAAAGRTAEARTLLDELRARPAGSPTVVSEAWLLGALGEIDAAFEVLARAEDECQANLYITGQPVFDALRADPRFTALLRRLGLPADARPL